ncbi:MAG: hypothetical protein KBE09_05315 [Candidatus Pacebacteria bacterium]|nr:hypothetical protein [Candidatus Paceibacterota bacterium]
MSQLATSLPLAITACVGALFFLAGSLWFANYTYVLTDEVVRLEGEARDVDSKSKYLSSVRALLRDTAQERAGLMAIADGVDAVALVQLLEDAARQARVQMSVEAVSPLGPHKKDPTLQGVQVTMHMEGSFVAMNVFLSLLQDFPVPSIVENAQLESLEGAWRGTVRVQLFTPVSEPAKEKSPEAQTDA